MWKRGPEFMEDRFQEEGCSVGVGPGKGGEWVAWQLDSSLIRALEQSIQTEKPNKIITIIITIMIINQ